MTDPSEIRLLHPVLSELPDRFKNMLFNPGLLRKEGLITNELRGRGTTYFYTLREYSCVLRHFWRGGWMRNISKDAYLWTGMKRSRAYREWIVLEELEKLGLPAPRGLALRIQRSGLCYRSDIVTEEIKDIEALGSLLVTRPLTEGEWAKVGSTIRRFHGHGVFHQDLNANNILLGKKACYFIDFDRARFLRGDWWKGRMLNRLQHSLEKLSGKHDPFHYNPVDWVSLMNGYDAESREFR